MKGFTFGALLLGLTCVGCSGGNPVNSYAIAQEAHPIKVIEQHENCHVPSDISKQAAELDR